MKIRAVFFLLLLLITFVVVAQNNAQCDTTAVYTVVDIPPLFPGGEQALMMYFNDNFHFPSATKDCGYVNTFLFTFIVDSTGHIICTEIIRPEPGHCILKDGYGEILLAMFNQMPQWEPGVHNGHKVKVRMNFPIRINFAE